MAAYLKLGDISASIPRNASRAANSSPARNNIIDVGDLPDGLTDQNESSFKNPLAQKDVLDLSDEARDIYKSTQAANTNPIGIEPNPSPKPRSDVGATSLTPTPSPAPRSDDPIGIAPLPTPHPNPLDSANSGFDRRV